MRTDEEFENERYWGIQKFTDPAEAFNVMKDVWGEDPHQPNLIIASTLSPSVTATSRMLSPKRITRSVFPSATARATRIQSAIRF